jgi:lipid II isoglutaminyl synthase (glutamine-hydrolysing)
MKKYNLTIGWLYPELMSTYGDRGNIIVLQKRSEWRNIKTEIRRLDVGFDLKQLATCDILFMGGAQDAQQQIVSADLAGKRTILKQLVEEGIPGLYICGAYQFLGKYYKEANGNTIDGLDILDLHTENPGENSTRLIGNVVAQMGEERIIGFENHGGRTYLGKNIRPFGKVIHGFGNNGKDETEGAIYKNSYGTYLHGPILPKNPVLADLLIKLALQKKYGSPACPPSTVVSSNCRRVEISPLNDLLETEARNAIAKRLGIKL